ncbi:MAG: hypothetical protein ACYTDY_03425, partial [Planctomycetota bacterium]
KEIDDDKAAFEADAGLQQTLETIPPPWAANLESRFPDLTRRLKEANEQETGAALDQALKFSEEQRLAEAIKLLGELIARSIPDVVPELIAFQESLAQRLAGNEMIAAQSWNAFLPSFLDLLGRRQWDAAAQELARLRDRVSTYVPNVYRDELMPAADQVLSLARDVEARFVANVDGAVSLPSLRFGTIKMGPVRDVQVEGRNLHFRYGAPQVRKLEEICYEDLFRYAEVGLEAPLNKLTHAALWLGELERIGTPRDKARELPSIESAVLEARVEPVLVSLVDEVVVLVRAKIVAATEAVQAFEDLAADKFDKAQQALTDGRYQDAYDGFVSLLENKVLAETEFVKSRKTLIQEGRDEAKKKLPGAQLGRWYRTRAEHLAGESVNKGYRAAITFDLEDEGQLERMKFTEGRLGIVKIEKLSLGPNPPGTDPDEERVEIQHLLRFLPAEEAPKDWLQFHPLTLESPFLYSREMTVRFKARWERPLAFLVSLCGTNVIVLSDDGRRENGRGVHIWQSADLSRPDRIVPQELRNTWIERHPEVLKGDAAHARYFQFEPDRWYRVRFVKGEKTAALYVDERLVFEQPIKQYGAKGQDMVILTYTPMKLDEIRIEGTVDPAWYLRRVVRAARAAKRGAAEDRK